MKQKKWDSKTKIKVVVEGFKGKSIASICNEYQISQSLYYQWRDQFMYALPWGVKYSGWGWKDPTLRK